MRLPKTTTCDACGAPASPLAGKLDNGKVACSATCAKVLIQAGLKA